MLITRQGKPLLSEARGLQNREKKVPNRLDTRFNLGSMNKMFTAVAVAQLAQQGKLKLTDTVAKHLPDYPNADLAKKVTLHHLLSHTGGTGDIFTPEYEANIAKLKTPKDYIALYGKRAAAVRARVALGLQQLRHGAGGGHRRAGQRHGLLRLHPQERLPARRHDRLRLVLEDRQDAPTWPRVTPTGRAPRART